MGGAHQHESGMMATAGADRELLTLKAGDLVLFGVAGTMRNLIDAGFRDLIAGFENTCHLNLPRLLPSDRWHGPPGRTRTGNRGRSRPRLPDHGYDRVRRTSTTPGSPTDSVWLNPRS